MVNLDLRSFRPDKLDWTSMIQTWLPFPSFKDSVRCLSDAHLGLQRLHVLDIIEVLHETESTMLPDDYERNADVSITLAVEMWENHEMQLCEYGLEVCDEYSARKGKKDKYYDLIFTHLDWATSESSNMGKPKWFGEIEFHMSHQAALLRMDPDHYRPYFIVSTDRELIWPKANG